MKAAASDDAGVGPGSFVMSESLAPSRAVAIVLDVTDLDTIDKKIAGVEEAIGPIDVLVNNAGYGHEGAMEESPLEEMRHQLDVNLFGAVALIKAVLPFMRKRRSGHIVNMTSMAGLVGLPGISYYVASRRRFRRFATRYYRRTIQFSGFAYLTAAMIWMR